MDPLSVLVCLISTFSVSGESLTYALTGQEVSLNPVMTWPQQPDEILWKHNGNKVVEFNGRTQQEFGLFKDRVSLYWISADLVIKDLRSDDSGEYDLEIFSNKKLSLQTLTLVVLDKLDKPNIMCERSKGSSSTDGEQATLTCSAQSRQPETLTYEWSSHGTGPNLIISLSDKSKQYTCMVRNRLINATAIFTAKDCYPDEGGFVPLIVGPSLAGVLIVAGIVVGIIFCKKKNKACFTKDVEKAADKRHGQSNATASNEEGRCLLDRTPTVPSNQRLAGLRQSNSNEPEEHERSDADTNPVKGFVKNTIKKFEANAHSSKLIQDAPTAPGRKPSNSSSKSAAGGDELAEPDPDPHQDVETEEPGLDVFEDPAPDQSGLADQNEENNPHSEPTAPSGQKPVSLPQDNSTMTSTCNDPDTSDKDHITHREDGQYQITQRETVKDLVEKFEDIPNKTAAEQQAHEDEGVESPPASKIQRPFPLPRQKQQQVPAAKAEDITEHNKGAGSNQVTEKTEEKPELHMKNDPDENNRNINVSDDTKSDNDLSLIPPSPEKPDQSKSGEHQESSAAKQPDLDQQNQDHTRQDSPEHEEQSDNKAKGEKGEDEGDTDERESEHEDSDEEEY